MNFGKIARNLQQTAASALPKVGAGKRRRITGEAMAAFAGIPARYLPDDIVATGSDGRIPLPLTPACQAAINGQRRFLPNQTCALRGKAAARLFDHFSTAGVVGEALHYAMC